MTPDEALIASLTEAHGRATKGEEWSRDRGILSTSKATVESKGNAWLWYDDGDGCAEVHGNMGMGYDADEWAELMALSVNALPRLIELAREAILSRAVVEAARPYVMTKGHPHSEDEFDVEGDTFWGTQAVGEKQEARLVAALSHLSEARKEGSK